MAQTVLLTRDAPEHRYVANKLASKGLIDTIIIDCGTDMPFRRRARLLVRRHGALGVFQRGALRLWDSVSGTARRRKQTLHELLTNKKVPADGSVRTYRVCGINNSASINLINDLSPDTILVYGTGIIKDTVLSSAKEIALNLHTGFSPFYRGSDCVFWPLYNNDFEKIGATVHECTSDLDGGKIFGRVSVSLKEDDNEAKLFCRCVIAGAELYEKIIAEKVWRYCSLKKKEVILSVGREYRSTERTPWKDLSLRRKIRKGLVRDYVSAKRYTRGDL